MRRDAEALLADFAFARRLRCCVISSMGFAAICYRWLRRFSSGEEFYDYRRFRHAALFSISGRIMSRL